MSNSEGGLKFRFNPRQAGITKVLGPLETDIMQVVWRLGQATVADVHRELRSRRDIAYTTVMTSMGRLADKKILSKRKIGVSFLYTPALAEDEFVDMVVKNVLDSLATEFKEPVFRYIVNYVANADEEHRAEVSRALHASDGK